MLLRLTLMLFLLNDVLAESSTESITKKEEGKESKGPKHAKVTLASKKGDLSQKGSVFIARLKHGKPDEEYIQSTRLSSAPWLPIDPEDMQKALVPGGGSERYAGLANKHRDSSNLTSPSWVFFTVESDDLLQYMKEKKESQESLLRQGRHELDIPAVVDLIKNLTMDYENVDFIEKLNKSLQNMSLPRCPRLMAFKSSTTKREVSNVLYYFIVLFFAIFFVVFE